VTVNTYRNLSMVTDRTGQVFPGGSVVYEHILTNNGNVTEGDAATEMLITGVNSLVGFTTVLYIDTNNNGVLDVTDLAINGVSGSDNFHTVTVGTAGTGLGNGLAGLSPGESVRIFAKVQAPAGATPGTTDAATITANVVGTVNTIAEPTDPVNTDTTNVIGGQIRLEKTQALDKNCNGSLVDVGDVAYTNSNLAALPGECIMYSILATNEGVSPVTSIVINDTTPQFTTLSVAPAPAVVVPGTSVGATTGINTNGATGALGATVNTLSGAETATFTFSVKIDQ
jgi:trimeric autotransporter adhesin